MNTSFDCDVLVLGLGPAGMAVSLMAHSLGLKVIAIEKHKIGGECLNVGCIPSKALLKTAKLRHMVSKFESFGLQACNTPAAVNPFARVREVVRQVNEGKTAKMFEKLDLVLGAGAAEFLDQHTVEVPGVRRVRARKIFICTGTRPFIPPIPGIKDVPILTNENLYELNHVPESLAVIGGGAIGCEMGQALSRLGSKVTILNADACLLPRADEEAGRLLCSEMSNEGIEVLNGSKVAEVKNSAGMINLRLDNGKEIAAHSLLVAAGREIALEGLKLERAGVEYDKARGIKVNSHLVTTCRHIFAVGDCNGYRLFTHAAMHQGMLALINSMLPGFLRYSYKNFPVPWSVFTDPEVSQVGATEQELKEQGIKFQVTKTAYSDYGRTTADSSEAGFVKVLHNNFGRILGAVIVGENSSEMIQEFTFAMQQRRGLPSILFMQHSFPTFSFMNKRVAENWMMRTAQSALLQLTAKLLFKSF